MAEDVYVLDDDPFLSCTAKQLVEDLGLTCRTFPTLEAFESVFPGPEPKCLIVDLAIPLGSSDLVDVVASRGGFETGIEVLRRVRKDWKATTLMLLTGNPSGPAQKWCSDNKVSYALKPVARETLERVLSLRNLRAFVVHGRDLKALERVKSLLGTLNVESVVLVERPSHGNTIIEKFEDYSGRCDCAVVVLSPDDFGGLAGATGTAASLRARQNVIYELGYFCGSFGRKTGRVILLKFGDIEIPSDLAGVVYLNGTKDPKELVGELQGEIDHLR